MRTQAASGQRAGWSGTLRRVVVFASLSVLAACASPSLQTTGLPPPPDTPIGGIHPYQGDLLQCVPYAQQVSGIAISGDAWTWWQAADGKYDRGHQPRVLSVLVLSRTERLR